MDHSVKDKENTPVDDSANDGDNTPVDDSAKDKENTPVDDSAHGVKTLSDDAAVARTNLDQEGR